MAEQNVCLASVLMSTYGPLIIACRYRLGKGGPRKIGLSQIFVRISPWVPQKFSKKK